MIESIEQTFNRQSDFGRRVNCTINRNGDLCFKTYLSITLPEIRIYTRKYINFIIIENVEEENKINNQHDNTNELTEDIYHQCEIQFYEDLFAGLISPEKIIDEKRINKYIESKNLFKKIYKLLEFLNQFIKAI